MIKNLPYNAGIPGQGTKISHAMEQLMLHNYGAHQLWSSRGTTREFMCLSERSCMNQQRSCLLHLRLMHLCSVTQSCSALQSTVSTAHQAPLSMGFPRQEYWCGLPFPSPGDLPNSSTKPTSSASPELAGRFFTAEPPGKPLTKTQCSQKGKVAQLEIVVVSR